eukprot:gb/GECG01004190.1/.p1 GENE.gb/GECG01004190.1/~~gb/GECG01004190.1/.p1  ORF type:complete len:111 (+),score=6.97 gb/GECG01004190.1/:1-333(+)
MDCGASHVVFAKSKVRSLVLVEDKHKAILMVPEADPAFDTLGSVNSRAMGYMCVCVYVFVFGFLIPWQYTSSTNHTRIAQIVETLVSAMLKWLSTCASELIALQKFSRNP